MDTQRIDELQKKTSGFVNGSLRVLRGGLKEAGRLLSATADATKLHIEKEARVIETHRDLHRLGEEVYKILRNEPKSTEVTVNPNMRVIVKRIIKAETEISKSRSRLEHMSVVSVSKEPVKRASKKKRESTVAQKVPRKPVSKRGKTNQ